MNTIIDEQIAVDAQIRDDADEIKMRRERIARNLRRLEVLKNAAQTLESVSGRGVA